MIDSLIHNTIIWVRLEAIPTLGVRLTFLGACFRQDAPTKIRRARGAETTRAI